MRSRGGGGGGERERDLACVGNLVSEIL